MFRQLKPMQHRRFTLTLAPSHSYPPSSHLLPHNYNQTFTLASSHTHTHTTLTPTHTLTSTLTTGICVRVFHETLHLAVRPNGKRHRLPHLQGLYPLVGLHSASDIARIHTRAHTYTCVFIHTILPPILHIDAHTPHSSYGHTHIYPTASAHGHTR